MGLMDDIEAAENARARGEPEGGRIRRRIGTIVAALGILLALLGSYASSWHVYDVDVVGYGRARVQVGLWDIEVCEEKADCEVMPRAQFETQLGQLSRSSDAAMASWLDARWQVGIGVFLSSAAAAVLLFMMATGQSFRAVRLMSVGTFLVSATSFLLAIRSSFADPIDFMSFGLATYLALFGLFDLVLAAILVGISRIGPTGPLPAASVVKRA
jgi:hypothetical protein